MPKQALVQKRYRAKRAPRKNAWRHGLSLSVLADPIFSAEAKNLAFKIAGEGAHPEIDGLAHRVAEAQIDLVRVRQARHDLLSRHLNDPKFRPYIKEVNTIRKIIAGLEDSISCNFSTICRSYPYWEPQGDEDLAHILSDLVPKLAAMDRYERRALSRRKAAIRALDALRL